jgi:formylglycine-generating enzyme required for sulfatase activity
MNNCPICQTRYNPQDTTICPTCNWDFNFNESKLARIKWGATIWSKLQQLDQSYQEILAQLNQEKRQNNLLNQKKYPFSFQVVTLNDQGLEIHRQTGTNYCFKEYLNPENILELALITSGSFWMGSPTTEIGHQPSESPLHQVRIPEFWMGIYPITQAQWRIIANYPQINLPLNPEPSHFKGDHLPVERISWFEAVEFCNRLSEQTGRFYRLPSEAEWEYAARGITSPLNMKQNLYYPFHFGAGISPQFANYNPETEDNFTNKSQYRQQTTPVGSFQVANNFGLYDIHGNVWEWCADYWHDHYEGSPGDHLPWHDHGNQKYRVLRGGSWSLNTHHCRCAYRDAYAPKLSDYGIGFRVVCS